MTKLPIFKDEQIEAEFWDNHDATDYLADTEEVALEFIDERPAKTAISIQLDIEMVEKLNLIASQKELTFQALMRLWIMERLAQEVS